jgi:RNA polymerase sigma factor (sigma-70 family)
MLVVRYQSNRQVKSRTINKMDELIMTSPTSQSAAKLPQLKQQLRELLPALRRFAISLCGNVADADDLLQGTIERLLTRNIPNDVQLLPWSFKVCRNLWVDDYRARKVRENATQRTELQEQQSTDDSERVIAQMRLKEVKKAMGQLPDDQRSVLALVAIQGLSYREAAQVLEVPTGTIMSRLARARSKLVELLELNQSGAPAC